MKNNYRKMWEDFGKDKSFTYSGYKFKPTHRVGLTNYLRENVIYKYLEPDDTDVILDAGCAAGRQLFQISPKIKEGYGTDISDNFIKKAKEINSKRQDTNLSFQQARLEDLPFDNSFFNKVICAEVLEHVEDKEKALKELKRVLKPGGFLIISVPNLNADATLWGRMLRLLGVRKFVPIKNFTNEEIKKHKDAHVREFTGKKLRSWLERSGFKTQDISNASYIDGPGFDFFLKFPLHIKIFRRFIIGFENLLNKTGLPYGRHLVIKVIKQ